MENPLWKAYEKLDDGIMYFVNKGARAWNWTTGQTKKDLANSLLGVAPIVDCMGLAYVGGISWSILPMSLFLSHFHQKNNEKYTSLEEDSNKNGALLNPRGKENLLNNVFAPLTAVFSGDNFIRAESTEDIFHIALGVGWGLRSTSYYVMRTDSLPPRKSVFGRVKDRLSKMAEEKALDSAEPVPMRYSTNMGDYLLK